MHSGRGNAVVLATHGQIQFSRCAYHARRVDAELLYVAYLLHSSVLAIRLTLLVSWLGLPGELIAQTSFFESDEGQWYHGKWESLAADAERGFNRVSDPVLLHVYKSISESSRFQLKALEKAWDDLSCVHTSLCRIIHCCSQDLLKKCLCFVSACCRAA